MSGRYRVEQIDGRTGLPRPKATFHVWQLGQVEGARNIMRDRIERTGQTNDRVKITDTWNDVEVTPPDRPEKT